MDKRSEIEAAYQEMINAGVEVDNIVRCHCGLLSRMPRSID
jgi:hypothetical protein